MSLVPTWMTTFPASGYLFKREGIRCSRTETLAPRKQYIAAARNLMFLTMESPMMIEAAAGGFGGWATEEARTGGSHTR